jgi:hypothetical protein
MKIARLYIVALLVLGWTGVVAAQELTAVAHPEQLGFSPPRLERITAAYQGYVDRGELPGAVLLIARDGKIAYLRAIGYQDREKQTPMLLECEPDRINYNLRRSGNCEHPSPHACRDRLAAHTVTER